jgi:hypothetical protein
MTLRYLTGQADLTDKNHNNSVFLSKNGQKRTFLTAFFHIEIGTLLHIICLKNAEFLVLTGIAGFGIILLGIKKSEI